MLLFPPSRERGVVLTVESERDLAGLRRVGRVVALALKQMREQLEPGMTTAELDTVGVAVFERYGARPAPRMVYGFPGVNLISVNDEAVHGVPGERVIHSGDLVKIDVTAELDGYIADSAATVALPGGSPVHEELRDCAALAFQRAAAIARSGRPINKIGRAIETVVKRRGFSVLAELTSHGVGRTIHEEPTVPNYYEERLKGTLTKGLVITIEPIISASSAWTVGSEDGWTIRTADGSPAAHHEHTIVITRGSPIILTAA
jgi:methionyl aminopeptidase